MTGIDDDTGGVFRARLCPDFEVVAGWLRQLPGPVAVVYEARQHPCPPAAGRGGLAPQAALSDTDQDDAARWDAAPAAARARGHAGNQRLHQRWQGFEARNKRPVIANVAAARELAGWYWSLAVLTES